MVLALLVLGPERLPAAARNLGKAYAEFRRFTGMAQAQVQDVVDEVMRPVKETSKQVQEGIFAPADPSVDGLTSEEAHDAAISGDPVVAPDAEAGTTEPASGSYGSPGVGFDPSLN